MGNAALKAIPSERGTVVKMRRVGFYGARSDFEAAKDLTEMQRSVIAKYLDPDYIMKLLDATGYSHASIARKIGQSPSTLHQKLKPPRRLRLTVPDARALFSAFRELGVVDLRGRPTKAACEIAAASPRLAVEGKKILKDGEEEIMRPIMLDEETWKAYGFTREPFTDALESELDIFRSNTQKAVLNKMIRAALSMQPIGVTAGKGCGKTVVKRQFIEDCRRNHKIHLIESFGYKQHLSPYHIEGELCLGLGMDKPPANRVMRLKKLIDALRIKAERGVSVIYLLDDAHDVREDTIRFLKQLYEKEHGFRKLFTFVLMGWPRVEAILNDSDAEEVGLRTPFIELRPFGLHQVKTYCEFRIGRAGASGKNGNGDILSDEVLKAFDKHIPDFGRPVIINNAMRRLLAYTKEFAKPRKLFEEVRKVSTAIAAIEWKPE